MKTPSNDDEKQEVQTELDVSEAQFFGAGYDAAEDSKRLKGALCWIFRVMAFRPDQVTTRWLTLREISDATASPEASVSASIRTLRNQYGFIIECKRKEKGSGVHLYRLTGKDPSQVKKKGKKRIAPMGDEALWSEFSHLHAVWEQNPTAQNRMAAQFVLDKWNNNLFNRKGFNHG